MVTAAVAGSSIRKRPTERGAANGRNIGRLAFKAMYKTTIINSALVPKRGRVIVAANHIGFLDGPLLFSAAPRPLHMLAKSELFKPPFDTMLNATGQIPVEYESADREAMLQALEVLQSGSGIGMFPEAHRGLGRFASMRHGIAYLHSRTNAPIVPTAIFGTRATGMGKEDLPKLRSPMVVVFGEPFTVPPVGDIDFRATLASIGETIRQRLADHVSAAQAATGMQLPTDDTAEEWHR